MSLLLNYFSPKSANKVVHYGFLGQDTIAANETTINKNYTPGSGEMAYRLRAPTRQLTTICNSILGLPHMDITTCKPPMHIK